MKRIGDIDSLGRDRANPSEAERERSRRERYQREKEEGYQRLSGLCVLGEVDEAKRLANQNPQWGFEIVEGEVREIEE